MTADRLSPGDFNIFYPTEKKGKPAVPLKLIQRYQYLSILAIFCITCITHAWLFFEQHIMKTLITPVILVATEAFLGDTPVVAASEQSPPTDAKPKDEKTSPSPEKQPLENTQKQTDPKKNDNEQFDPLSLDESRIKILLSLHEREKELKKLEEAGRIKDNSKKALDIQLDKKIAELKELKKVIETVARANNDEVMKNVKKMVAVYEAMKPEAAARIFNELPQQVLSGLIKQMSPKKASAILSQMSVEKAKALTDTIAFSPLVPESDAKKGK